LLSLPAIAGATLIQCLRMESIDGFITALPSGWLVGCILASASGYLALVFLRRVVISGRFKAFAVYCAALGAISILFDYMTR
ncbi:MAG TPA: undecaprenyl-diphosphate phosphatase, partial [Thermosynergistes sp.]|nr:undecaprenyl-diphosphate phosphatase [Thermosynergistes sp.]